MRNIHYIFLVLIFFAMQLNAQIYVATTGNDSNPGTITSPLLTPAAAFAKITGGGQTIIIRGGTYKSTIQLKTPKDGAAGNYINFFAYPGETPVLDFTGLNDRGLYISKSYWYIKGITECNAGSNGICFSTGGNNILEGCVAHDNGLEGIKLTNGAHDDYILNCDSYRNYDAPNHGEDADGFAMKSGAGTGNSFHGCRSWNNADDGWDFYGCPTSATIDSCWAFDNGVNVWNDASFQGDGNGFKLGGGGALGEMIVRNSIAFEGSGQSGNGFDQNHATSGQTILNCTGWSNSGTNYSFYEASTTGTLLHHVLKNNLNFNGKIDIYTTAVQVTNSWQGVGTGTQNDLVASDFASATAPRNADFSLPNSFGRLKAGSGFIDVGTNIGLPYYGIAPDLGAFEWRPTTDVKEITNAPLTFALVQNYPNPFNPTTTIQYSIGAKQIVTLIVYDILGKEIATLVNEEKQPGLYKVNFDASKLSSGVYFAKLQAGTNIQSIKLLLMK